MTATIHELHPHHTGTTPSMTLDYTHRAAWLAAHDVWPEDVPRMFAGFPAGVRAAMAGSLAELQASRT